MFPGLLSQGYSASHFTLGSNNYHPYGMSQNAEGMVVSRARGGDAQHRNPGKQQPLQKLRSFIGKMPKA